MLGAIIGDIVGSRFEFHNYRKKDFELFSNKCFFTDDTVMTCAIADYLTNKNDLIKTLKLYGRKYPYCGFGNHFSHWIMSNDTESYYSFGNGAAMRISAVGWIAKNENEVKKLSREITEVTHDHPEGLKGAEVTAMCIFYARNGKDKEFIKSYAISQYPIIKNLNYLDLVREYRFNETCQNTVPQAIYCFLISDDFEDCVRNSISIGGDSDTLAAISCAIAEAYWGVPSEFKKEVLKYFNKEDKELLLKAIHNFNLKIGIDDL